MRSKWRTTPGAATAPGDALAPRAAARALRQGQPARTTRPAPTRPYAGGEFAGCRGLGQPADPRVGIRQQEERHVGAPEARQRLRGRRSAGRRREQVEQRRLEQQGEVYRRLANWTLDALGLASGPAEVTRLTPIDSRPVPAERPEIVRRGAAGGAVWRPSRCREYTLRRTES